MTMSSAVEYLSASIPAHCGETGTKAWLRVLRNMHKNSEGSFDKEFYETWIGDIEIALQDYNSKED